jgi:gas vesicle protein
MSRTKLALAMAGVAVTAAAAGWAAGLLLAPASGKELRRRLAWRTEEQWRSAASASNRMFERVATRARHELHGRGARIAEAIGTRIG